MNIFNDNVLLARHSISYMYMWLEVASNDLLTFTLLPVQLITIMWNKNKAARQQNSPAD